MRQVAAGIEVHRQHGVARLHVRQGLGEMLLQPGAGLGSGETTPGYVRRWHAWWDDHGDRFPKGMRHRDGRVFDAGLLIEKMEHSMGLRYRYVRKEE